jgi:hypothetical protein
MPLSETISTIPVGGIGDAKVAFNKRAFREDRDAHRALVGEAATEEGRPPTDLELALDEVFTGAGEVRVLRV